MNYQEALEYIHSISNVFCKPGLYRIKTLCDRFNNPQDDLRFIHVAGTNAKGSTCAMLNSILVKQGLKVGLFTSPYIKFFNERICINNVPINNDELIKLTYEAKKVIDTLEDKPTEFELITLLGFLYFKKHKCDIVILETGMGGRYDSTNIIKNPLLTIITSISIDHTNYLGNTIESIAKEKAGIIKNNVPVLYGGDNDIARKIFILEAKDNNAFYYETNYNLLKINSASLEGSNIEYKNYKDLNISLLGLHQTRNACIVIESVELLRKQGITISDEAIKSGLNNTYWPARFEILNKDPLIIFDGAHNQEGISSFVESIKYYFKDEKLCILTGVLKDMDYEFIAKKLSDIAKKVYTVTLNNPRALKAEDYASVFKENNIDAVSCLSIKEAYDKACRYAKENNVSLVCVGSLYLYALINEFK